MMTGCLSLDHLNNKNDFQTLQQLHGGVLQKKSETYLEHQQCSFFAIIVKAKSC